MSSDLLQGFRLGPWQVEPTLGAITGPNGETQHLEPKVMDVLVLLAGQPNKLASRNQLLDAVWSGHVAADELLTGAISELRHALHDHRGDPQYIETIPKRGYRLISDVHPHDGTKIATDFPLAEPNARPRRHRWTIVIVTAMAPVLIYFAYNGFVTERKQEETTVTTTSPLEDVIETDRWEKSIAVLPFANMSDDPGNEYFSDGLTEEILTLLAKTRGLKVIGRTSSFAFKGKNEDLRDTGHALGVKTILEGSVRKSGERVRITAQLVDVSDGSHIWAESYDRNMTDIFAVQDDVAAAIIDALQIHVGGHPGRGRPAENMRAYASFLKARAAINNADYEESAAHSLNAVQLDSNFAESWELLAHSYFNQLYRMDATEVQKLTFEAADRALAIDPDLVLARALYESSSVESFSMLKQIEALERAVREQPGNPWALQQLFYDLMINGYLEEGVRIAERYVELEPLVLEAHYCLALALFAAGRFSEAITAMEVIEQLGDADANWKYGVMYLVEKQDDVAIAYFEAWRTWIVASRKLLLPCRKTTSSIGKRNYSSGTCISDSLIDISRQFLILTLLTRPGRMRLSPSSAELPIGDLALRRIQSIWKSSKPWASSMFGSTAGHRISAKKRVADGSANNWREFSLP